MTNSIFYSWQADLPNNTNRGFIRGCLDRAIKAINLDLEVDEVLRAEDGVKGVPGTPDVANRIFERVDACLIFVADISIIGEVSSGRRVPNPNVMIEYGRATKSIGDERILTVFNENFGDWRKDRPFDLRHKLQPVCYSLAKDHSKDERSDVRAGLTKLLEAAIREIIEAEKLKKKERGTNRPDLVAVVRDEAWIEENRRQATKSLDELAISMRWEFLSSIPDKSVVTTQRELMENARQSNIKTFGWPIGIFLENNEDRPTPKQDGIAATVIGRNKLSFDHWTWNLSGHFYMQKSIFEDQKDQSAIFFNTRICRTTETLMYLRNMYAALGLAPGATIEIHNRYTGFLGREMKASGARWLHDNSISTENNARSKVSVTLEILQGDLVPTVKAILEPFFVLFDFFEMSDEIYTDIVSKFIDGKCS